MINIKIIAAYNKYFTLIQKVEILKLFLVNCYRKSVSIHASLGDEDDKFIEIVRQIENGDIDFYGFLDIQYLYNIEPPESNMSVNCFARLDIREAAQFWLNIFHKNLPEELQTSLNREFIATSAYFDLNVERLIKEVKDSFALLFADEDLAFSEPIQPWTKEGRHTKDPRYMMSRKGRRR